MSITITCIEVLFVTVCNPGGIIMLNLNLTTLNEIKSFSEEEFICAIREQYEAAEELFKAEQELFEINRAVENIVTIQDIVAKYGWNEVLNDLVGDQISAETLNTACEGMFDKVKKAVTKVKQNFSNWFNRIKRVFAHYESDFEIALKQLKEKKMSNDVSSEAITSNTNHVQYFDIGKILRMIKSLDDKTYTDKISVEKLADREIQIRTNFKQAYYSFHREDPIDLKSLSYEKLYQVCADALHDLKDLRSYIPKIASEYEESKNRTSNLTKQYMNDRITIDKSTSLKERSEAEKRMNNTPNDLDSEHKKRVVNRTMRQLYMISLRNCDILKQELRRRGVKFYLNK